MLERYIALFAMEDNNDEEWVIGQLLYDGKMLYYDGIAPDPSSGHPVPKGKSLDDVANDTFFNHYALETKRKTRLVRQILDYGEYYPRIYRPFAFNGGRFIREREISMIAIQEEMDPGQNPPSNYPAIPINTSTYLKSLSQLALFREQLTTIFRTVEPEASNLNVYGHEIRNLLVISCTEVESHWKAILRENNQLPSRASTRDYVKLLTPLKLDEYSISLPLYPGIPVISPFSKWNNTNPTQSLDWYDAYNKTKHDRETDFNQATLLNTITAITACAIMVLAQFGKRNSWDDYLGEFFQLHQIPKWLPEEMYMRTSNQKFSSINYPF